MDHVVSVTTTQLCSFSAKVAIDNTKMIKHGCAPIKLYVQKRAGGRILPEGCSLAHLCHRVKSMFLQCTSPLICGVLGALALPT